MAALIPEQPKDCPYGERSVYEKLGRDLHADWIVLHSLGLHGHEKKIWGEADIVVLSTKGFFALEVKGGKVSCKEGVWHYGEPGKPGYTKKEDPWTQAKGCMFAVRERLIQVDHAFGELLFGFGVVMPVETFTTTGAEIEPAVLVDSREFRHQNLGRYIGRLQQHWEGVYRAKHGRVPGLPTRVDIQRARAVLRPDVDSALSIGSYLTGIDARIVQLTNDQVRASRRMSANPRTIVRGRAGTGKTVIAMERARQLAASGAKVLFLCFNQLLATHVRLCMQSDSVLRDVEVRHVHALFREVIEAAGMAGKLSEAVDEELLYAETYPRTFVNAAIELDLPAWDALVIDEAQDLLTPDNIDAFDLMLGSPGINRGRWHIFLDREQNIYGSDIQDQVEKRLSEAVPAFDDLFENCRNTRQVAVQASIISGIDLALDGAPDGLPCDNIYYKDSKTCLAALDATVTRLLRQGVPAGEMVVLSTRKRENSTVAGVATLAELPLIDAASSKAGDLVFSTMHSFKGLERQVVLAIDMAEIGQARWKMLHYAGLSRARALLHTFLPETQKPLYSLQADAFAARVATQT